jgi:hypothetical protein
MISSEKICEWLREIEKQKIPRPIWIQQKEVFEYAELNVEIVAFLKAVRAAQSLHSLPALANAGLLLDFGTITRAIEECVQDIYFLLEPNSEHENRVAQYVEHFRNTTIDTALESTHQPISRNKIMNAASRSSRSVFGNVSPQFGVHEQAWKEHSSNIWNAWCNETHSNYASIMQIYGPVGEDPNFQLSGIPSTAQNLMQDLSDCINEVNLRVAIVLFFMATRFGLQTVAEKIKGELD